LRLQSGQSTGSRRAQNHFQKLLDERRLGDLVTLRKRSNERFDFRCDPTLNECVCRHGSNRVTKAAARLSCISLKIQRNWQSLPGPTLASAPVVATGASGWPLVFIKATDGALWYIEQLDSERWSTWATLGGAMVSTPTVIMNGERHLEIFAVGAAGDVWHIVNTEPHVWSNWESLGMKAASRPILGLDYRRCLEMFVASDDSSTLLLYRREQIVPCGSAGWSEPVPLGTFDPEVALTHNEHGVLEVFAIRHNSFSSFSVTHSNQDPTDLTKWSEFVSLANAPRGAVTPIALHDDAARPHLFATGSDGMLWTIAEVDAQSTRTNWSELGRPASGDIFHFSVGQNDDGRFEAFAIGADMNIWHKWETKLRGDWSDWVPLRTQ
jgi:hypothetical protein